MKIAIVGTGVSGLVAAHLLHPHHEITVYEAADRVGGHVNTVAVSDGPRTHFVDTGFIVCNDRNYPRFERLLAEIGVATQPSHMSFSVSDGAGGFEYSGTPRGVFAKRAHLFDPAYLMMLREWFRFNREAQKLIGLNGSSPSLGDWLDERGYSQPFVDKLIVPQASAVWSADPAQMWSFPAGFMAEFFDNHGMYSLRNRPQWRTIAGGSHRYVEAITAPWRDRIRLGAPVRSVTRGASGVDIMADGCETETFDEVVIASHSDQALEMLADPTPAEHEVLGAIAYQPNEAVLHTDISMLPRRRRAWASWNFHLSDEPTGKSTVTYWMNNLQRIDSQSELLVTLNRTAEIDPEKVLKRISYDHPIFTSEAVGAQARHREISGADRIHYCGAYWGWGFHEDGVVSAEKACASLVRDAMVTA